MLQMSFHVGQKAVCITDDWLHPSSPIAISKPHRGGIYHVRAIDFCEIVGTNFLRFEEIVNPIVPGYRNEPDFLADCFRPIVEKKTDISVFTAMLDPSAASEGSAPVCLPSPAGAGSDLQIKIEPGV